MNLKSGCMNLVEISLICRSGRSCVQHATFLFLFLFARTIIQMRVRSVLLERAEIIHKIQTSVFGWSLRGRGGDGGGGGGEKEEKSLTRSFLRQ